MSTQDLQVNGNTTTVDLCTTGATKTINIGAVGDTVNAPGLFGNATAANEITLEGDAGGAAVMVGSTYRVTSFGNLTVVYGSLEWSDKGTIGINESVILKVVSAPPTSTVTSVMHLYESDGLDEPFNHQVYILRDAGVLDFRLRYQDLSGGDRGDVEGSSLENSGVIQFTGYSFTG